jgi:hypothetical protein
MCYDCKCKTWPVKILDMKWNSENYIFCIQIILSLSSVYKVLAK